MIIERKLEVQTELTLFSDKGGMGDTIRRRGVLLDLDEGARYSMEIPRKGSVPAWQRKSFIVESGNPKYTQNPSRTDMDTDVLTASYVLHEE